MTRLWCSDAVCIPNKAKEQYESLNEEAQKDIERKVYEKYGDDVKEVRYI